MVSMPSLHFFRWAEQLKGSGHEIYWFDVVDGGHEVARIDWVYQIVGWKCKYDFLGRYFIKKKFPKLYRFIQKFNEYDTAKVFEGKLLEIKPDVVHSFALYVSCTPIFTIMEKHATIPWIYSSWGSDLFYFKENPAYLKDIQKVLPRVDFMFSDCKRDVEIARNLGFSGVLLGIFPGGGGFSFNDYEPFKLPFEKRKIILIKGYQGRSGRVIAVLQCLEQLAKEVQEYEIVVFGADPEVVAYIKKQQLQMLLSLVFFEKISHNTVMELMGKSFVYIGNSNSDGLPNTLLEAIGMGAFPIQSNPGGVTEEIITNGLNGLLISDSDNLESIKTVLLKALFSRDLLKKGIELNTAKLTPSLERETVKSFVLEAYNLVEQNILQ
jgi:glycosyltransferase involved in cell wall biosynthesis